MNRSAQVRRVLAEGPTTSTELAATLKLSPRRARVALWILTSRGQAQTIGRIPVPRGRALHIYALTARGRAARRSRA